MKPQIHISLDVEDHDRPQPGDVEIGQNIIWSDISKADWPIVAAKLEQIALLLRDKATA
ncbi:hypothetical protein [Bifidobacterium adolescentis]|uniref:hypothetical protein n=1 Tax=Bifidobacterium adolescentis TaxID=1680 RepID=UPI00319E701D